MLPFKSNLISWDVTLDKKLTSNKAYHQFFCLSQTCVIEQQILQMKGQNMSLVHEKVYPLMALEIVEFIFHNKCFN